MPFAIARCEVCGTYDYATITLLQGIQSKGGRFMRCMVCTSCRGNKTADELIDWLEVRRDIM
jgi:hypothetical protein